jgi:hypothetical protein
MSRKRVPDILIEQYVLGELPEEKAREVERSEGFADRVAAIERDNVAFLEQCPPEAFVTRIQNQYEAEQQQASAAPRLRSARSRTRTIRFMALAVPGAAAALTLAFVLLGGIGLDTTPVVDPDDEIVRLKGAEPEISIYRSVAGEAEELSDGDAASQGDRLQITYTAADKPYGAIVSVDGRGTVTLHFPLTASGEPELVVGGEQQLPYAYQLDDAPDFERFFFVTSEQSFDVRRLLSRIESQADEIVADPSRPLQLSREFTVESVIIRKGA